MSSQGYKPLKRQEFALNEYIIKPIDYEDRLPIRTWRNEQIDILRQDKPLSAEDQDRYFQKVIMPLFDQEWPRQILFSIFHKGNMIGYGGLVHINWMDKRSEVSFLLETTRNQDIDLFKEEYGIFLELMKVVAFEELGLNKLTTEAFDLRNYLIETLEAHGFVQEGHLRKHNLIEGEWKDSLLHACFSPLTDS